MCDTDEHMMLGDAAAAWIPGLLNNLTAKLGNASDYDQGAFGPGGWFTNFQSGQFRYGPGDDEWASYGDVLAISGDYFATEKAFIGAPSNTEALLKEWHEKVKGGASFTMVDPDGTTMIQRALSNWPHFGFEAIALWKTIHQQAIAIAIAGRDGSFATMANPDGSGTLVSTDITAQQLASKPISAALLLALRHNAFGDHYFSDLFSTGHMRVLRQDYFKLMNPSVNFNTADPQSSATWQLKISEKVLAPKTVDMASVLAGIGHDEDSNHGLWCNLLLGDVTLNGLGNLSSVSGQHPDPDTGATTGITWAAPITSIGTPFFAMGDDHMSDAPDSLALCHYAIGLSIRDILIASITGKDPMQDSDTQGKIGYWDAIGGKANVMYPSLRLVPQPIDGSASWAPCDTNLANKPVNHLPLLMPNYGAGDTSGMGTYYANLKTQIGGGTPTRPTGFLVRGSAKGFDDQSITFGSSTTVIIKGRTWTSGTYSPMANPIYFDFMDRVNNGDPSVPLTADQWKALEEGFFVPRYIDYKGGGFIAGEKESAKRWAVAQATAAANAVEAAAEAKKQQATAALQAAKQQALDDANAAKAKADADYQAAKQAASDKYAAAQQQLADAQKALSDQADALAKKAAAAKADLAARYNATKDAASARATALGNRLSALKSSLPSW